MMFLSYGRRTINLAKSKVLKGFSMLRGQLSSDVGVEFNTSDFLSRADDLENKGYG